MYYIIAIICSIVIFDNITYAKSIARNQHQQFDADDQMEDDENAYLDEFTPKSAKFITRKKQNTNIRNPNDTKILSNWVYAMWPCIKDMPLMSISIPGTHDSGTAVISKSNAVISTDGRAPNISIAAPLMANWACTQNLTIAEQLKHGVRFFDFRLSYENGTWYLSHGLRGENLTKVLDAIKAFCDTNPREFIIIKVKAFADDKCKTIDLNTDFANTFKKHLGQLLLDRSNDSKSVIHITPAELYKLNQRIIVFFDKRLKKGKTGRHINQCFKTYTFLHDGESLYSDWANTPSTEKLAETQIKLNVPNNKWHAMHITLTANPKYIVSHLNTQGILDMTKKLDKNFDAEKRISKMFSFAPQNWKQEIMTMKDIAQQQRNTALLRLINQCSTVVNSEFNRSLFSMLLQNAYLTRNNLGIVACDFINQQKVLSILLYNLISYVDRSNLNNEI